MPGGVAREPVPAETPASPSQTVAVPDGPLVIPPTRPSTSGPAQSPFAQLPFTKKQLMIGGGGVLAVIIIIAIVAGGGSKSGGRKDSPPPKGSGSAAVKQAPREDPLPKLIERGKALIESQQYEDAVEMLKSARKSHPDNAELAFLAGKAYFNELWWTDGVENFRDAIRIDPDYKNDPDLLKTVLKGFLTTPDVDDVIVDFMRNDLGEAMRPYLEETAASHPKKALRSRAKAELNARPPR
jgi:hypothetical protein